MKDITGQRFGKWTAIKPTPERQDGKVVWLCKCDCGTLGYVVNSNLQKGRSKSCGCMRRKNKGV